MWPLRHSRAFVVGLIVGLSAVSLLAQVVVRSNATRFPSVSVEMAGSEGSPSITFVGSPSKGLFLFNATSVGISGNLLPGTTGLYDLGGPTQMFRNLWVSGAINSGSMMFGDGSAGAPSITFTSAPTKGFYKYNATTIGVSGFLGAGADATYDIGLVTSTRFRNGFFTGILAASKVQVGAGTPTATNITMVNTSSALLSVRLGDESDFGDLKARAITSTAYLQLAPSGVQPTCSVTYRGALWFTAGAAGVADQMQMCGRDPSGSYFWVTIQ